MSNLLPNSLTSAKPERSLAFITNIFEIYAKFSLRRLEMDFPSLVNSNNSSKKRDNEHRFDGHKPSFNPLNASIVST